MTKKFRKLFFHAIATLFIGTVVASSIAQAADKIVMGSRDTNLDVILLESGLAKKYDLDIEVVRVKTGIEMAEALIGGGIDIGIVGGSPLVSAILRTDKITLVGSAWITDGGYAKVIVRKDSPIKSIEDLKGKKIANKIGSGS